MDGKTSAETNPKEQEILRITEVSP